MQGNAWYNLEQFFRMSMQGGMPVPSYCGLAVGLIVLLALLHVHLPSTMILWDRIVP